MSRILVIDDEVVVRELMIEILERAGYDVIGADSAERALALLGDESISLVVSDIVMPGLSGLELLETVRARRPSLPVVLVTGAGTFDHLTAALAQGADGLVLKPFRHADLRGAVATALERADRSEQELKERLLTPTLAGALANAIEARDPDLHGHCERLSALAILLGSRVGLGLTDIETIRLGAILHDIGKIGIPDRVLLKDGPLSAEEKALMQTHTLVGDRLLEPLDIFGTVRPIVRNHHERWEGQGYPDGLLGDQIPLGARIVAVADSIEAMSANRPYRDRLAQAEILAELEEGRGSQWEPQLVDVVLDLIRSGDVSVDGGLEVAEPALAPGATGPLSVLLVEADQAAAARAIEALETRLANVEVEYAPDVQSAIELARRPGWAIALIDGQLPNGGGVGLLEALRRRNPGLPIVMISEEGADQDIVEAFRHGAADCVLRRHGYVDELTNRVRTLAQGPSRGGVRLG